MCQTASTKCDTNIANDEQPPSANSCTDGFVHFSLHTLGCLYCIPANNHFGFAFAFLSSPVIYNKLIVTVNNPPKHV